MPLNLKDSTSFLIQSMISLFPGLNRDLPNPEAGDILMCHRPSLISKVAWNFLALLFKKCNSSFQTTCTAAQLNSLAPAASASGRPGSATAKTIVTTAKMKHRKSARADLHRVTRTDNFDVKDRASVSSMNRFVTAIKIALVRIVFSNVGVQQQFPTIK